MLHSIFPIAVGIKSTKLIFKMVLMVQVESKTCKFNTKKSYENFVAQSLADLSTFVGGEILYRLNFLFVIFWLVI